MSLSETKSDLQNRPLLVGCPANVLPHESTIVELDRPREIQILKKTLDSNGELVLVSPLSLHMNSDPVPGCLAKVISGETRVNGRFLTLLTGLRRVAVSDSIVDSQGMHWARFHDIVDCYSDPSQDSPAGLRHRLILAVESTVRKQGRHDLASLLRNEEISLGSLADLLAASFPHSCPQYVKFLEERKVHARARLLIQMFRGLPDSYTTSTPWMDSLFRHREN